MDSKIGFEMSLIVVEAIGGVTVTLHAVSRGRLAPLVGRRFFVVGLYVYFAGIQSLFAFISLTHKIMNLFCIGAGYIGHCVDGSFYFVTIKKGNFNEEKSGWMHSVVNSGED